MPTTYAQLFAGRPYRSEAEIESFISRWASVLSDSSGLTAGEISYLEQGCRVAAKNGVLDIRDRDYWIDRAMREDGVPLSGGRLLFTNPNNSDPLGLATGQSHVIIIDPQNTNHYTVGYSGAANQMRDFGGNIPATANLWDSTSDNTYNNMVDSVALWGRISSLSENGGGAATRRFPRTTDPVSVYIRGGDHNSGRTNTAVEQILIFKQAAVDDNLWINIRAYPGEEPKLYMASELLASVYSWDIWLMAISRPHVSIRSLVFYGHYSGIFAPQILGVDGNADDFLLADCEFREYRAISSGHADAGDWPGFVDSVFDDRDPTPSGDFLAGDCIGVVSTDGWEIRNCLLRPAPVDFPEDGGGDGHSISTVTATNGLITYCTLEGSQGHGQIILTSTGAGNYTTATVIDHCDISNSHNSGILGAFADGITVQYSRIHDFAWHADADDGSAMQIGGTGSDNQNWTIRGNVIFNLQTPGGVSFGMIYGCHPTDGIEASGINATYNIFWRSAVAARYFTGSMASSALIFNNTVNSNVIADFPPNNPDPRDSLINTLLRPADEQTSNQFQGNLFALTTGTITGSYQLAVGGPTNLDYDDVLGGYSGNFTDSINNLFADVPNGDFRVLRGTKAETVLAPYLDQIPLTNGSAGYKARGAISYPTFTHENEKPLRAGVGPTRKQIAQATP